jgi:hypothetical protein
MSKSSTFDQVFLSDGKGGQLPIQTGTWISKSFDVKERRRLSMTVGVQGSTASGTIVQNGGGFTGTLLVQGTNEIGNCNGYTGTPNAGVPQVPGQNGQTGALFWNTLAGGTINITTATTSLLIDFTDLGCAYIRFAFNIASSGNAVVAGNVPSGAGGTGTMFVTYTAKAT